MRTSSGIDRSVRRQRIVWLIWVLCGLAIMLAAAALVLQAFGPRAVAAPVLVQDALLVALELLCVLIGGLISLHRPGNRVGGLLLAGALALSAFSFLENYFGYAAQHPGVLPDLCAAAWIANGWFVAGLDALLLMVLVYPTGTLPSSRWRPVAWLLVAWGLVAVVLSTVQPTLVMAPTVPNPVGVHGPTATFVEQALVAAILPLLFFLPAAVVSLIVRFRPARGQQRQQLKWLLYAGALSATATILNNLGVLGAGAGPSTTSSPWPSRSPSGSPCCAIGCTRSTG
jgi:hypothetical protein